MDSFYAVETLREELRKTLGFTNLSTLNNWLESPAMKTLIDEFSRDYLTAHHGDADADYKKVTDLLGANQLLSFASYTNGRTINKSGWSPEKHWVRMISQMGAYAQTHDSAWKAPANEDMEIWFYHGYEVVRFVKADFHNDRQLETNGGS